MGIDTSNYSLLAEPPITLASESRLDYKSTDTAGHSHARVPQRGCYEARWRIVSLIYQRSWGCFIVLYGLVFIVIGTAVGDDTGIFLDVAGLAMMVVGLVLFISYYLRNPPK